METKLSFILILSVEDTNKLSTNAARKSMAPSLVLLIMSLESSAEIVRATYTVTILLMHITQIAPALMYAW